MSVSTSQIGNRSSVGSYTSLVYRRLSFEDDLFTARVYKRNYRTLSSERVRRKASTPAAKKLQNIIQATTSPGAEYPGNFVQITTSPDAKPPSNGIQVTTSISIGFSKMEPITGTSNSAIDSYADLVALCGNGDSHAVEKQLGMMLANHPDDPEISSLFGSQISEFLCFCPIYAAVANGQVGVMKTLLRYAELKKDFGQVLEKPIGGIEDDHCRPLHLAVMKENYSMVELLLEKGASVHSETGSGLQALHLAAKLGSMELFMALIDAGADMNCTDPQGRKPFHYASRSDIKSYLRERHATDVPMSPWDWLTSLEMACEEDITRNPKVSWLDELLLDEPLEADGSTQSALTYRSKENSSDEAWSDQAQPDFPLQDLDTAIELGLASSVESLIRNGIDPNKCRSDRGTGLDTFVLDYYSSVSTVSRDYSSDKRILRLLLERVNLRAVDRNGGTILDRILERGRERGEPRTRILARLFLECLPEHKSFERDKLRSMLFEYLKLNVEVWDIVHQSG